jgi:pantothenate kinase
MAGSQILELSLRKATEISKEKRVHNARGSFRMGISGPPGVGKSTVGAIPRVPYSASHFSRGRPGSTSL